MRQFLFVLTILIFTACAPKESGKVPAVSGGVETNKPTGPQPNEPQWGELNCQKHSSCEDLVLNADWYNLMVFLQSSFSRQIRNPNEPEKAIYQCGVVLGKAWTKWFGGDGMDPRLDEFFLQVMDVSTCTAKPDLEQHVNNYFIQSKEYKNEIR